MPENLEICKSCGSPIPPDAPGGTCPRCMMGLGQLLTTEDTEMDNATGATVLMTEAQKGETLESTWVGHYKLLERIGVGGMGEVYMAEQTEPIRRKVALKIIKLGMDTKQVIARFEAERQALALMDHPNIARIIDGGATETGRPYFVMELVHGIPITQYCDQGKLSIRERLSLFTQVCHAIQHAHSKGIIHRDIKPSNVMVTQHDGVPFPKVIDFGIAKATSQTLTDKTMFTGFGQLVGTPQYMSPEQAELNNLDVDTRSDIYSLGVLLYELLTGSTPFDKTQVQHAALNELCRLIREVEPAKPSTRISTMGERVLNVAEVRSTAAKRLGKLVRGELDWVVMKTLEKDRKRRYETASSLAVDVEHFLDGTPVEAAPPSFFYRASKVIRRHKKALAGAALVFVALVAAVLVSTNQAIRALKAEQMARKAEEKASSTAAAERSAREDAEEINAFLTRAFGSPDPARQGRSITIAETLDTTVDELATRFADRPLRRARLQSTLGETYHALGLFGDAIKLHEQAHAVFILKRGLNDPETLGVAAKLLASYRAGERQNQALALAKSLLAESRKSFGDAHERTLTAMAELAHCYADSGRNDEALEMRETVLKAFREQHDEAHPATLQAMANLADSYAEADRQDEALTLRKVVADSRQKRLASDHPHTLTALQKLALSYHALGRHGEALTMQEQVLQLSRRALGDEHPATIAILCDLAARYEPRSYQAHELRQEALERVQKRYGDEHAKTLQAMDGLARHYRLTRQGNAVALASEVFALSRQLLGMTHSDTLEALSHLAICTADVRRWDDALVLAEETLLMSRSMHGEHAPRTLRALADLAVFCHVAGARERALIVQQECLTITESLHGDDSSAYADARTVLAIVFGGSEAQEQKPDVDAQTLSFQQGVDSGFGSYEMTQLARIQANAPHEQQNDLQMAVQGKPRFQVLLQFSGVVADRPGAIPAGARILSAKLRLRTVNPGVKPSLYQMATEWASKDVTFDNARLNGNDVAGIQLHGREAYPIPVAVAPTGGRGVIDIDVTASVQNWANGDANYGWVLTAHSGTNAWAAANITNADLTARPALIVTFTEGNGEHETARVDRLGSAVAAGQHVHAVSTHAPRPIDSATALHLGTLQAWFGQHEQGAGYVRHLLAWAAGTQAARDAERAAKVNSLSASNDIAAQIAVAMAQRAVEADVADARMVVWDYLALGMALYRAGDYDKAMVALAIGGDTKYHQTEHEVDLDHRKDTASLYQAMCLDKLGRAGEARKLFTETETKMKPAPADRFAVLSGKANADDLVLWLAFKEVEAMLYPLVRGRH